jgi:tetratricopeptide (TPR) repeat protein
MNQCLRRRLFSDVISSTFVAFAAVLITCLVSIAAGAPDRQVIFDEANRAYEQGKFAQAISGYEQLLKDGARSSAIFFNLGNAWFRTGRVGKAIAHYRLAERLSPRDTDIRANLDFARRAPQEGEVPRPKQWGAWSQRLTTDEWTQATSFFLWLLLFMLSASRLRPSLKSSLKNWIGTAAVMLLLAGTGLTASHLTTRPGTEAVIAAATASIRYGPFDESQSHFTLRDGTEVSVVDRKGDWAQVRDASQRTGWLKAEHLAFVDLP